MKLPTGRIEGFLRRPDPKQPTILLYGPDQGLVGARVQRLLSVLIDDPADPFLVTDLDGETLRQHPGRLVEEAQALSLMGGRRAVRLRHAAEAGIKAVGQLLELEQQEAVVLIEAGDLGPASALRKTIERAANAVAIPCYREEGRGLATSINAILEQEGLQLDPDALVYLNDHLGVDHGITRREIEKLATFAGPDAGTMTLSEVAMVVGDASALSLDDLIFAILDHKPEAAAAALERLLAEGHNPIGIVRPLARYLMRLYRLAGLVEAGTDRGKVVEQARPPIHFRRKAQLREALATWSRPAIAQSLDRLGQLETSCKQTGIPAQLCCRQVLPALAQPPV